MRLICVTLAIFCVSAVRPFEFKQIDGINDVKFIEFDADSNIYIGCNRNSDASFYKLNSEKEIIVSDEHSFTRIKKILVTSLNNAYIFGEAKSSSTGSLFFLGHNSSSIDLIFKLNLEPSQQSVYFKDAEDNIFFNSYFGVSFLKTRDLEQPGLTAPKSINNLGYFTITSDSTYAIDKYGNIYLGGKIIVGNVLRVAYIPSHEKQKSMLTAQILNISNDYIDSISAVSLDANGENSLIAVRGPMSKIYKASSGNIEPVHGEYLHHYGSFHSAKDRFIFFGRDLYTGDCFLNYGHYDYRTSSYVISVIANETFNSDFDCVNLDSSHYSSDNAGNIYFSGKDKVFVLRNNETEVRRIYFSSVLNSGINAIVADNNDNLWIVATGLYVVRKDTLEATQVTNFAFYGNDRGPMKVHPFTQELFIGTSGLFVYSD